MNDSLAGIERPLDLARLWREDEGFCFLDASLPEAGAVSLLCRKPDLILRGRDWAHLDAAVREYADARCPGAAVGTVDFDGVYEFGFYPEVAVSRGSQAGVLRSLPSCEPMPEMTRERYCAMVEQAKEWIAAGDIYQVCLAHRFSCNWAGDPWDFYENLRAVSPAPCAAFLRQSERAVLSASPESFLRMSGRRIVTKPIKGTRPRGRDAEEDAHLREALVGSAKERAELVMITDLERNDLGQICDFGSVRVEELLALKTYEQVFHLVSTVTGELRPEVSHVQALQACFPGGSISGAPKKRALEIIRTLEPCERGLYTGAIGYFGFGGESHFSIAIRTAVAERGRLHFHSGAGIVADSEPEQEWQETLHKAAGLLRAAGGQ